MRADAAVIETLLRQGMTPEESQEAITPFIYDPATPRERINEDMAIRMKWYPTPQGYAGQLQGIFGWEAYSAHRADNRPNARYPRRNQQAHSSRQRQINR